MKNEWEEERKYIIDAKKIKEDINSLNHEAELAEKNADFNKVAEIRYAKVP